MDHTFLTILLAFCAGSVTYASWFLRHVIFDEAILTCPLTMKVAVTQLRTQSHRAVGSVTLWGDETLPVVMVGWGFIAHVVVARLSDDVHYEMRVYRMHRTAVAQISLQEPHISLISGVSEIDVVINKASSHYPKWETTKQIAYIPGEVGPLAVPTATAMLAHVRAREKHLGFLNASIVLCGPPGTGKSTAARILADRLTATFSSDYNPCAPGHKMSAVIAQADENSLVVLIDEFDEMMRRCFETPQGIPEHPELATEVRNRCGWNKMCDDARYLKGLVRVYSTNCTAEQLYKMDPTGSALRLGRVTAIFNVGGGDAAVSHCGSIGSPLLMQICSDQESISTESSDEDFDPHGTQDVFMKPCLLS